MLRIRMLTICRTRFPSPVHCRRQGQSGGHRCKPCRIIWAQGLWTRCALGALGAPKVYKRGVSPHPLRLAGPSLTTNCLLMPEKSGSMAKFTLSFLSALALLNTAHGAPAVPRAAATSSGANPPLRGSPDLAGYSPSNTVSDEDTNAFSYSLAPGQTADANLGLYLDFSNVDNPQPIRGSKGGNDPGPSKPLVYANHCSAANHVTTKRTLSSKSSRVTS